MQDLLGQRFGRLEVIQRDRLDGSFRYWRCRCVCGREKVARGYNLLHGLTSSCGCLQEESRKTAQRRHGRTKSPEHRAWVGMRSRCYYPKDASYKHYGARGIVVCERWRQEQGFENFLVDMGPRPSSKHSLDRVNNNGNYEPSNCRWATTTEQQKNRRKYQALENFSDEEICREFSRRFLEGKQWNGFPLI